jgi:hypothetical protein
VFQATSGLDPSSSAAGSLRFCDGSYSMAPRSHLGKATTHPTILFRELVKSEPLDGVSEIID